MAYEVFAFWNGADVNTSLNAVTAIMGGGDYLGLMKAVAMVGLISAVTYALLAQRGQALGGFFAGFVFVYGVMFVPRVDVIVNDVRAGTTSVVSNVPLGLAMPYATLSHIGYWLTMQYESRFTTLDDERFSKTGMVFGARVLETLTGSSIVDAGLKADIATFYKDCVVPELMDDPSKATALRRSNDISSTLTPMMNPGRGTALGVVKHLGSGAMPCDVVPGEVQAYIVTQALNDKTLTEYGRKIRANEGPAITDAMLASQTETDVENMLTNLLSMSDTATQALTQSMWINRIHDADMAFRNGYGNAETTSYAAAVTSQSVRQSAYSGKIWADKALPLIRNIAEFVLIAVFPLIFIIILVAGENALMALKLYMGILASLALWAPLTAILNYQVISNGKAVLGSIIKMGSGITLNNIEGVMDLALEQQALAGQLFLMVPVIAYALVSAGAYAATSAMGSLTSSGGGSSSKVSGEAAVGNVGGGQVGWRNTNALNSTTGQTNTAMTTRAGFRQNEDAFGTTVTPNGAPGGGTFVARTSSLGSISASVADTVQTQAATRLASSSQATRSAANQAMQSMQAVEAAGHRSEKTSAAIASFQAAMAATSGSEAKRHFAEGLSNATQAQNQIANQAGEKTSANIGGDAGRVLTGGKGAAAGGGGGDPMKSGLSIGADYGKFSTNTMQSTNGQSAGSSEATGTSDATTVGASESSTLSRSANNTNSRSKFAQDQIEKAKGFASQGQAQAQKMESAERTLSAMRSSDGSVRTDLGQLVVERMGGAAAAADLYSRDSQEFAKQATALAGEVFAAKGLDAAPATSSSTEIEAKAAGVDSTVARQVSNAPKEASAPTVNMPGNTAPTGSTPRSVPPSNATPRSSTVTTPASPEMPSAVQSPAGKTLVADRVVGDATAMQGSTKERISDGAAGVSRRVGNVTEESKKK